MDGKGYISSLKLLWLGYSWAFFPQGKASHLQINGREVTTSRCVPEVRDQREVGERARILFFVVYIWVAFIGAS